MMHSIRYSCAMASRQLTTCSKTGGSTICRSSKKRKNTKLRAMLSWKLSKSTPNIHLRSTLRCKTLHRCFESPVKMSAVSNRELNGSTHFSIILNNSTTCTSTVNVPWGREGWRGDTNKYMAYMWVAVQGIVSYPTTDLKYCTEKRLSMLSLRLDIKVLKPNSGLVL